MIIFTKKWMSQVQVTVRMILIKNEDINMGKSKWSSSFIYYYYYYYYLLLLLLLLNSNSDTYRDNTTGGSTGAST